MGGGDHFGGADPDAAPLDDGEVLHHHQYHPHFYFPVYWFRLQVMVNNIIATAGLIEVIGLELFGTILKDEFSRCFFKSNAELQSGRFQEESTTRVGKALPSQVF